MQITFPASPQQIHGARCFEERQFRWEKQVSAPLDQWRIETRVPKETSWTAPLDALRQLLAAVGHRILDDSLSYIRWQVDRYSIIFRANRVGSNWTIESQEWGGVQWHGCDTWCLSNLAFGSESSTGNIATCGVGAGPADPVVTVYRLIDPSNSVRADGCQPRYKEYSMTPYAG